MILFPQTYIIKREDNIGSYDDSGKYEPGEFTEIEIQADCQVITGKEIETLNIGRDNLGKIKIFTDEELIISETGTDGTNLRNGDIIIFQNRNYEIIQRLDFINNLIPHIEYIGELRIDDNE